MRHVNIPVFIPHLGCPHMCVFCNQHTISNTAVFDPRSVRASIEAALQTVEDDAECELAYFGGSFTGIDRELMIYLLDTAAEFVKEGRISSIRCSTRPDYIDSDIINILSRYPVKTVELGVQSMSDAVLAASERGHTSEDTRRAVSLLHECGIRTGGQMMVGLPLSTGRDEIECAREICELGCAETRIYPTIVFRGTALSDMMRRGEYEPLTLEAAVERTADALRIFDEAGVKVLRVGLCDNENLHSAEYEAGPNHPAIGELAASRVFYKKMRHSVSRLLSDGDASGKNVVIYIPRGALSKAIGQHRCNRSAIESEFALASLRFVEKNDMSGFDVTAITA